MNPQTSRNTELVPWTNTMARVQWYMKFKNPKTQLKSSSLGYNGQAMNYVFDSRGHFCLFKISTILQLVSWSRSKGCTMCKRNFCILFLHQRVLQMLKELSECTLSTICLLPWKSSVPNVIFLQAPEFSG